MMSLKQQFVTSMVSSTVLLLLLPLLLLQLDGALAANYTNTQTTGASSSGSPAYGVNFFAESSNTYYDGYQQAWRYLGWYVSCGHPSDRYTASQEHSHDSNEGKEYGNMYCQRYLMWAAYVDPQYSGGGIGEYSFYDYTSQQWDETACTNHGNGRCAPMDCHEMDTTTWELLGVFKEAVYFGNDAFFEQLFKHEGVCVWNNDDTYEFMSEAREDSWAEGCIQTYTSNDEGTGYLYIDLKPTYNGNMTYALYTDYICKTEYDGLSVSVDSVAASMGLLYGSYLDQWNDALEIYKVCQPCRAYNLQYSGGGNKNSYQSRYSKYSNGKYQYYSKSASASSGYGQYSKYRYSNRYGNGRELANDDYYYDPNDGYFQCEDDADYTNVNQCMKFRTHAELEVATWEDLVAATNQGGILQINVSGTIFGSERISREQEAYVDSVRRQQVAQEKAEAKAAQEALRVSEKKKSQSFRYMVAGAIALAFSVLITCKNIVNTAGSSDNEELAEPLYNERGVSA